MKYKKTNEITVFHSLGEKKFNIKNIKSLKDFPLDVSRIVFKS